MTATQPDFVALTERIGRLERQNRRFKFGTLGMALFAGTALLMGSQDTGKEKNGAVDRFGLKDANGKERLRISMGPDGPMMSFLDDTGAEQGAIGATRQGIAMRYLGGRGQLVTGVSLERAGVALVNIDGQGLLQSGPNAIKPDAGLLGPRRP